MLPGNSRNTEVNHIEIDHTEINIDAAAAAIQGVGRMVETKAHELRKRLVPPPPHPLASMTFDLVASVKTSVPRLM